MLDEYDRTRSILERRYQYEARIKELGGVIPPPWPWDIDGELRNLQLLELLECLEGIERC